MENYNKIASVVRMYSFISRAGAYACTSTQARKCNNYTFKKGVLKRLNYSYGAKPIQYC